ncbi:MAG: MBG domain-containing protein [Coriobacteriales bacterium]|jgi:uncharacterized repeat protein (TIGR02543 family)
MLVRILDRISRGSHTPEGKVISIVLAICFAMMTWQPAAISSAFADEAAAENPEAVVETVDNSTTTKAGDSAGGPSSGDSSAAAPAASDNENASDASGTTDSASSASDDASSNTSSDTPATDETPDTTDGSDADAIVSDATDSSAASDDAADKDDEAKKADDEKKMPAVTLTGSANGVSVTVVAPDGALPEGARLKVTALSSSSVQAAVEGVVSDEVTEIKAVDITFTDKDGKPIDPAKSVKVSLTSSLVGKATSNEDAGVKLVHIDGGKAELVSAAASGSQVTFNSKEFSPYVLTLTAAADNAKAAKDETPTWTVTFYNRDAQVYQTVDVARGEAIGELPPTIYREDYTAYWAVGEIVQGGQGPEIHELGPRIGSTFVPTADTIIVPDYDKITYTVSFLNEDKTQTIDTETVDASTSYCLNDIPVVPAKDGYVGKWVYSGGDFNNSVKITANTDVWPEYEKNVFTVTYKLDEDTTYQTDTYYKGDELSLPTAPVVEGKQFVKWVDSKTGAEVTTGTVVNGDITATADFTDMYAVTFVVEGSTEHLHQYFRTGGEAIGTMPQDPFVAGKVFEKWVNQDTGEEVTAETIVNDSITAVAQFRTIDVYNITAEYYYLNNSGQEVIFNTDLMQAEAHEIPYTITAPSTTRTDPQEVPGAPIYYPETPTVTVKAAGFDEHKACTVRIKYVPYTAEYDFVYMLKDLTGSGYTEIPDSREHVYGVLNSYVTPTVKNFSYAELESAQGTEITQAEGQELVVKYTRKNYQLSYDTKGGSYVQGVTVPYGTEQAVTTTVPTRTGYTFAGWYTDPGCTQAAGNRVTITKDTTLYAKWNGDTVDYTIVYMFEKYNDAGTASSFVYDNSKTGSGTVGSTIYANDRSIPEITKKGWVKDEERNAASNVVIEADGSAVLYVYYKLREYTFTFDINGSSTDNRYRMTIKERTYQDGNSSSNRYSFTAKLGQDVSADWPSNGGNATIWDNNNRNKQYFYYWNCQDTPYASKILRITDELLPNGTSTNIAVSGAWRNNNSNVQINYLLQNADDDDYTLSTLYSQAVPQANYTHKQIAGYEFDHERNVGPHYNIWGQVTYYDEYNFYYNRHTYQIEYYHATDKLKTISNVKHDATITGSTYNWTPTAAQCGVDSDYTFAGWYDNPECEGSPYAFSKMPAGATNGSVALVLYAKWVAPSYTVSFVDGDSPSTELAPSQTVEKYKKASAPELTPHKDGYTFEGWYTTADGNTLYDWSNQITQNTTVYAHWAKSTLGYTVHYVDENNNPLADDKVVRNPNLVAGQDITEQAIAIAGYRPTTNSKTITLRENEEANVITFYYAAKAATTSYLVKYIIDPAEYPGNIEVAESKTVEDVPGDTASVIEMAKPVDYAALRAAHPELAQLEFYPDEVEKTLVLTSSAETNVYTFKYSSFKHADVTVHFVDMDGNPIASDYKQTLKVGNNFALSRTPIAGWELNKAVEGTSYDGTPAGDEYKITEETTANGLEFTLFYQKKVTITANSKTKQYDGTPLTLPESLSGQVAVAGLPEGESLTGIQFTYANADVDNGRLNAGVATVTPKNAVTNKSSDHASNYYAFHYISGTLEVTKINVTIRIEPDRWTGNVYDGDVKEAGFTNPNKGIADYVIISHAGYKTEYLDDVWNVVKSKATYDPSAAGLGYIGIAKSDAGPVGDNYQYTYFENAVTLADLPVDPNYSVSLYVRPGILEIKPAPLTVTTGSAEKPYDGTPLTNSTVTITSGSLMTGDTLVATATGSVTNVADNAEGNNPIAEGYKIMHGDEDVTANYAITAVAGTLTINPKAVTVTAASENFTYDGTAHSNANYTVDGLVGDDAISAVVTGSITFPSESPVTNVLASYEFTSGTAGNYTVTTANGELTMDKASAKITITAASDSKTYDGSALTNSTVTVTSGKLFEGDELVATATGSVTNVADNAEGNNPIAEGYKIMHGDEDVTANYAITAVAGTLTINPKAVTVTAASENFTYDGTAHSNANYTVDGLVGDDAISAVVTGSITFPSESPVTNVLASYEFTSGTAGNYTVTTANGELTMDKASAKITITAASDSKTYDGSALTNSTVTVTSGKLFEGDELVATATGSVTNVADTAAGNNPIAPGYKIMHGTEDVTANYAITPVAGKLTITPAKITITADDKEKVYDNNATTDPALTAAVTGKPASGVDPSYSLSREPGQDVDEYEITVTADAAANPNYTIEVAPGIFKITKRTLTITAKPQEYTYNATSQGEFGGTYTDSEVISGKVEVTGLQNGDAITSIKLVGNDWRANVYPEKIRPYEAQIGDATNNYDITYVSGTLTIKKAQLTITAEPQEYTYNGQEQGPAGTYSSDFDTYVTVEGLKGTNVITEITLSGKKTDAGTYTGEIVPSAVKIGVVTDNYDITYVNGTLTIKKAAITIKADEKTKVYDGDESTDPTLTATVTGKPAGGVDPVYSLSRQPGQDVDEYAITVTADAAANPNYDITVEGNTFEITKRPITIKVDDKTKVYDGDESTDPELTATVTGKPEKGDALVYSLSREPGQDVGEYPITASVSADDNPNYDITVEGEGKLEITKASATVTITGNTASKVYSGATQSTTGYTLSISDPTGKLAQSDIAFSGNATASGKNVGSYNMGLKAGQFSTTNGNFDVTFKVAKDGKLTITPAKLTVTADNKSKVAGAADPALTWKVSGLKGSDSRGVLRVNISRAAGEAVGSYAITPSGAATQGNYNVTFVPGTLTITAAPAPAPAPTPDRGVTPAPEPDAAPTPADDATPAAETIDDNATPMADTIIDDGIPMAAPQGSWSLFDLLASIVTVILCLGMLITIAGGRKDDEDEDEENKQPEQDEDEPKTKRHIGVRIAGIIPAVVAVVLFILTQDLTQPMVIFDKWTIVFAVIAIVEIILAIASRKKKDENDDDDAQQTA